MEKSGIKNGAIAKAIASMFPGYFALAMATRIVSVAAFHLEMKAISWALLIVNIIVFTILSLLLLIRLIFFFRLSKPILLIIFGDRAFSPSLPERVFSAAS